jgi:hypothetical protein
VRRLLAADGLGTVAVLSTSAVAPGGLDALRDVLADAVVAHVAALRRVAADLDAVYSGLSGVTGGPARQALEAAAVDELTTALSSAAGVSAVGTAVRQAYRHRASMTMGSPILRWLRRLRPDPLRRLHLSGREAQRTSLPGATGVQRAEVSAAGRALAARASDGLPDPWPGLVRGAATGEEDGLAERLDRAVAGTPLPDRRPRWWAVLGMAQRLLAVVAAVGALWLVGLAGLGYLQLADAVPTPDLEGFPVPTVLLLGGLLLGLLLGAVTRWANGIGARRRGRVAARRLRARVAEVAEDGILSRVAGELEAHGALCSALAVARGERQRRQ